MLNLHQKDAMRGVEDAFRLCSHMNLRIIVVMDHPGPPYLVAIDEGDYLYALRAGLHEVRALVEASECPESIVENVGLTIAEVI